MVLLTRTLGPSVGRVTVKGELVGSLLGCSEANSSPLLGEEQR